jgi:FG-GAP-like repeat/FG-GAP repeat
LTLSLPPGDFDGDGYPDLLARMPDGTLWLYSGTGTGGLMTPGGPFNSGWQIYDALVGPGDFDEDGHPDLLARKPDGTLWLYRGDGHGNFISAGVQIDANWNQFVELITPGDFNGDGHADVLGRKPDGTLWMFNGAGDGTFLQNGGTLINVGWDAFNAVVGVW